MGVGQNGVEVQATNGKATNGTKTSTNGSTNGNGKAFVKENFNGTVVMRNPAVDLPRQFDANGEILDPHCDPNNPQKISFHDITSAAFLIKDGVERTPCPVSFQSDLDEYVQLLKMSSVFSSH